MGATPTAETATVSGATGASTAESSTAESSTGATTTGSGAVSCEEVAASLYPKPECGPCVADQCCDEIQQCASDPICADCLEGKGPCDGPAVQAIDQCMFSACKDACAYVDSIPLACDAPALSPSAGSCVTISPPPKPSTCATDYELRFVSPACEECIESQCCDAVDACAADDACSECMKGPKSWTCAHDAVTPQPLASCVSAEDKCKAACTDVAYRCNPVTNAGCSDQEKCLPLNSGATACFEIPGSEAVCADCTRAYDACASGSFCPNYENGHCVKTCCDHNDCGSGACAMLFEYGVCYAN